MSQIEKAMHRRGSTSGDDDGKKSRIRYEILLEGKYKQVESVDKERLVQASASLDRGVSKSAWHVGSLESIPGRNSAGEACTGQRVSGQGRVQVGLARRVAREHSGQELGR
ncbi:hypothetical protein Bbelb_108750 [Branchiostoma belcheri]|nr:hypothetical protein Bbelb_108750 [Branchiostoma belcheri]